VTLLVRIVTDAPVRYSLDNGISVTEYSPGEVYAVPDFAGANMIKRGWAKQVKPEDLDKPKDEEPADDVVMDLRGIKAKEGES